MTEPTTDNVVPLHERAKDADAPVREKRDPNAPRSRTRQCEHHETDIIPETRRLVCRKCGELVDPFDFLLKLAQEDGRWRAARDAAEREARLAKKRVEDLIREEHNAKGRLRRMRAQERDLQRALTQLDAELRAFTPDPQREESS